MTTDTIYALSSGQPPAAIAVVRISGGQSDAVLHRLAGLLPPPRHASLINLKSPDGELLDRGLALRFPRPNTATGEDIVELHLHGSRAVVASVLAVLAQQPGLRAAEPGEFTRRAFANGRIDLLEAEGLADLLSAETESQRKAALRLAGGVLSRFAQSCTDRVLALAARVETVLDFADEGDVAPGLEGAWHADLASLRAELAAMLARPPAERLRDGVRVVVAGPPNAGKSTLLNALAGRDAAITSPVAGTTRDLIEAPMALGGVPLLLVDSAGLRDNAEEIEAIGVSRAQAAMAAADLILWLGDPAAAPQGRVLSIGARMDLIGADPRADISVSAVTGEGMDQLRTRLLSEARILLPAEQEVAVNARQRDEFRSALAHLQRAEAEDLLIVAEELRQARLAFDRLTGRAGVEDMLDDLFGRFCIGK